MPRVEFTANLKRHTDCPPAEAEGSSVAEVLDRIFVDAPQLRGYVLDDQGALRKHMTIFIDSVPIQDRIQLSDSVSPESTIYIFQALSGG